MRKVIPVSNIVGAAGTAALVAFFCSMMAFFESSARTLEGTFLLYALTAALAALLFAVVVLKIARESWLVVMDKPFVLFWIVALLLIPAALQVLLEWNVFVWGAGTFAFCEIASVLVGMVASNLVMLLGGMWGSLFADSEDKRLCFCALCAAFISGIGCFSLLLIAGASPVFYSMLLVVGGFAAAGSFAAVRRTVTIPRKPWDESSTDDTASTMLKLRPYTAGFAFALYTMFASCESGLLSTMAGISIGGFLALCALVTYSLKMKEVPSFFIEPWMFFVAEIVLVLSYMMKPVAVLSALFGGAFAVYYLMYFAAINLTASRRDLNPYTHFTMRVFRPMLGVAFGLLVGMAMRLLAPEWGGGSVVLLLSFMALSVNHLRDPHYWQEWASLYRFANDSTDEMTSVELGAQTLNIVRWEDSCRSMADRFELSEREKDVFVLLAKGRNAALIAEKLFISTNTARTHIYRVYSKTGLKNQQELISFVEDEQKKRKGKGL